MTTNQTQYVLGLDLDGVSAQYSEGLKTFVAQELGLPDSAFPVQRSYSFTESGWPFADRDEYMDMHCRGVERGLFRFLQPMPGIADAMRRLDDEGVHVRVVTHRLLRKGDYATVVADTVSWLDLHDIRYRSICFSSMKDSIGASAYVDDAPSNVESIRAAGTHVFVFDQPYNQDVAGPRIFDWETGVDQILEHKAKLGL